MRGMDAGLLFCTDCHNKYEMVPLYVLECVHTIRPKYITIYSMLYLLFYVMIMLFYLYICNYVTYRGP